MTTGRLMVKRCVNPVCAEALDIFRHEEFSESCGSWCDLLDDPCVSSACDPVILSGVPAVTDVVVSLSFVVIVSDGVLSASDCECFVPQSFPFSNTCSIVCVENKENMSYEGTPVKAPPNTRRRMMPPTPQQSS